MATLTKAPTLGDLLKYELNGNYTRETITLKSGTDYALGSVLGKITASGKYRLSPAAQVVGDEGAETAGAVLIEAVDATAADKTGLVVARGPAIVSKAALVFDASVDQAAEKTANLETSIQANSLLQLSAGDYVEVFTYFTTNDGYIAANTNEFWGHYVP